MENQVSQPIWGNWGSNNGYWSSPSSVEKWVEENPKFNLFLQYYGIEEEFIEICEYGLNYSDLYDKFKNKPEILTKIFVFLNNIKDKWNETPLYCACWKNNLEMVKLLLENGGRASVNIKDKYGITSLIFIACSNNNLEMVKLLLENGTKESVNIKDIDNEIPLFWAKEYNNKEIIELLEKYLDK